MLKTDTSPKVQNHYDEMIMALTPQERFRRGLSLTHFCRQLCRAGILADHPDYNEIQIKQEMFRRIYGTVFDGGS